VSTKAGEKPAVIITKCTKGGTLDKRNRRGWECFYLCQLRRCERRWGFEQREGAQKTVSRTQSTASTL